MKFRKISSLFLAMTIASTTVLTGCSSSKDEGSTSKSDSDGNVELVWYMIGAQDPDVSMVMEKVNEYTKEKIGVTVDLRKIDWGDYGQKMQIITSSGEPYDICYASDYELNAQKGAYLEITDELLDNQGKELKEAINPLFLEGAAINGKLYAIPANKEVGQQLGWAYNAEMAKEIGVEEEMKNAKTLEDLEPILEKVKAAKPDLKMPMAAGSGFFPYMPYDYLLGEGLPFGIALDGDTTKVVNIYEQESTLNTLKTLRRYYQKGLIHPQAGTDNDPHDMSVQNWFVRKEQFAPGAVEMWSSNAKYQIGYTPMHDPITLNNSVTGSLMAISSTSKNPEKAMEFLNLLNTDEYIRNLLDKGIEGVHYKDNGDGTVSKTDKSERYSLASWATGNIFILKPWDTDPEDKIEQYEAFNEQSEAGPTLGFYVDTAGISTQLATLSNVVQEFKAPLFTGSVDPEKYVEELNKKLKAAGADDVIANIQTQYDAWLATQK
ncbi:MAG: ABC transporter substrate-binding protein [Romboutsia sp.]|uniref:ABC transporter substrate-binding protein n=1 Tax=Romboutsia sp. TaxID=1965302 RepID=UPI003F33B5C6